MNECDITGKGVVCILNVEACKIIQRKTRFITRQVGEDNFCHFPLLEKYMKPESASAKVTNHLQCLEDKIPVFKKIESNLKFALLSHQC